jgi:ATP-binding cassette subfamily B multidrug efflux pump
MNDIKLFLSMLSDLKGQRRWLVIALLLYLPVTALSLAQPLLIAATAQQGVKGDGFENVTFYASLFLCAVILHAIFEMSQLFMMQLMGQRFVRVSRQRLFEKAQRLPLSYLDKTPIGRILARMTNDVDSVSELFASGAVSVIGDAFFLFATLVMLFIVDVKLTLATLVTAPILVIGLKFLRQWIRDAYHWVRTSYSKLAGFLQENYSGAMTSQLFTQVGRKKHEFELENDEYMVANRRAVILDAMIYSFVDAISYFALACVIMAAYWLHNYDLIQVGVLVVFVEALNRFFMPVRELANRFAIFQSAMVSIERIAEFSAINVEQRRDEPHLPARFERSLAFEDVSFGYAQGQNILSNVSFEVKKGEHVALVGRTGAGKSTVAKLLPRFYDVVQGKVTFDGADALQMDVYELRRLFNVVPQEVFLFSGTVRDNLSYGRDSASDAELVEALKRCQAFDLIERKGGLDALVASGSHGFSLGERQLLALARCLIAQPEIIIMDEATASIDPLTERRLKVATEEALKDRTALIIAHRLSTIEWCDRILVFQKGRIVESGTHVELMAVNGYYARLVELQQKEEELKAATLM